MFTDFLFLEFLGWVTCFCLTVLLSVVQMLLCHSAYPGTRQTLCIYKLFAAEGPVDNAKRRRFNKIAAGGRVLDEQVYGTWKARFPYLRETMRLNMENCVTVIIATALLHNFFGVAREWVFRGSIGYKR